MASAKTALKAIKSAIDAGDFSKASSQAHDLLKQDGGNVTCLMFLGFAEEKQGHFDEAEKALLKAHELKPQDEQPCKGLINLFEKQDASKIDKYHVIVQDLALIYAEKDKPEDAQTVVNKYDTFIKKHASRAQYRRALTLQLPSSPLYSVLEGRVPHPSHTYHRILESSQQEEAEWITSQIADRRTRIGSKLDRVTQEVKYEAIAKFEVEQCYQNLIDWTQDDEQRHILEQELLQRMLDNLLALPQSEKPMQRDRVLEKANGMVLIKQQFALAWNIALEWVDSESLVDWDPNILRSYIEFFPDEGLSKVLRGLVDGPGSPFLPIRLEEPEGDAPTKMSEADQLILMNEGLEDCKSSMLAHRIVAHTYLTLEEHQSAAEIARVALKLYSGAITDYDLQLQDSIDAVSLILGRALIIYQSPRHHPEARALFEDTLSRKPLLTEALLGIGLIYEEDEDWSEAVKFLARASERDPTNARISLEYAWCRAQDNDFEAGLLELEKLLEQFEDQKNANMSMKAEILYRIAFCKWHIDQSPKARRDKIGPYRYLIDSLKANPSYAPAYSLLGFYFQDYAKNKPRARVAFQKAFELSSSELLAAEQLARVFADASEWDLVELVAQRVIDSGKARPAPGSKKPAYSWPYAAMGVVQMNRSQYSLSIPSFQHALRISPNDYHCWVGLGESYHNSGRYIAASRAFHRAESIDHNLPSEQTWFAKYMLANVQREVGAHADAIQSYGAVLAIRPDEPGVLIALLQTTADYAWTSLHRGQFGKAAGLSTQALAVAQKIADRDTTTFNLWKSAGDALSVMSITGFCATTESALSAQKLLKTSLEAAEFDLNSKDQISVDDLGSESTGVAEKLIYAAVLAYKRAVHAASHDVHAQAVAWYNLGCAEHAAWLALESSQQKPRKAILKAAIKSFRHAIELEASNADFWNALGVVTMMLNPKVAQHAFVRSLHLNENSARTWSNLGALYLNNHEVGLANDAFTRAQSADPEYADAWIGQGLLAVSYGNVKEARALFKHAFEIAESSFAPAQRHFATSTFDHLAKNPHGSSDITNLLQPLFALRHLRNLQPSDMVTAHLLAQFAERIGEFDTAKDNLDMVCRDAEDRYEESESNESLARFAQAKTDLARQYLAMKQYDEAIENAKFALDVSEEDLGPAYAVRRKNVRVSAGLTAGLAHSFLGQMNDAITMLRTTLELTKSSKSGKTDPDVICILAQILWATGGEKERDAARNQLFEAVDERPDHIGLTTLLAVVVLLDGDEEALEVAEEDLKNLKSSARASVVDKLKIAKLLTAILSLKAGTAGSEQQVVADALSSIMLSPQQPQGWLELAEISGEAVASEMALKNARQQVPPRGNLDAEGLARTYILTGKEDDLKHAAMLAPWLEHD